MPHGALGLKSYGSQISILHSAEPVWRIIMDDIQLWHRLLLFYAFIIIKIFLFFFNSIKHTTRCFGVEELKVIDIDFALW